MERDVSHWADWSDSELIDQAAGGSQHPALIDDEIVRESIAMNVIKPFRQRITTLTSQRDKYKLDAETYQAFNQDNCKQIAELETQRDKLVRALKLFECIDFDHFTEHDELLLETVREDVRALLAELSQEGA